MRLQDFMSRDVETVDERTPADEALTRMRARSLRHLVVMADRRVAGVLSERDLGGRRAASLTRGRTVGELMSRHPVTIGPEATVREAARVLRGRNIGCLPVTDRGRLVGIVTTSDLLEMIGRGAEKPVETSRRWTLRNRGPRRRAGIRRGS
jgi:acetoin utilization protein AcuB